MLYSSLNARQSARSSAVFPDPTGLEGCPSASRPSVHVSSLWDGARGDVPADTNGESALGPVSPGIIGHVTLGKLACHLRMSTHPQPATSHVSHEMRITKKGKGAGLTGMFEVLVRMPMFSRISMIMRVSLVVVVMGMGMRAICAGGGSTGGSSAQTVLKSRDGLCHDCGDSDWQVKIRG